MPPRPALREAILEFANDPTNSNLPSALGFTASPHPPNILRNETPFADAAKDIASAIHRVGLVETPQGEAALFVVRLHEWGLRSSDRDRWRRRIAKAFIYHFPGNRPLIALIPPEDVWKKNPTQRDVEFVIPKVRAKGDVTTVRALVNAAEPSGFHVRLLRDIQLATGMDLSAISRHWAEAFSVERVTTNFYKEFEQLRDRLVEVIQKNNAKHPLLGGKENLAEVNRFATRQLGRILFVWFLQSKHWLDDDEQFLSNLYEQHCRKGKKNYFNDILLPLFFQALALPKSARPDNANTLLGAIPYLNGGLFMPTDFEDKLFGEKLELAGDIDVPNELFDPRVRKVDGKGDASVLGLLLSYRFTTRESTPDDMSVDPDPELLGKVFENLNEIGERHDTGTYYTPREIVRFMCREAIDGYLCDEANVDRTQLEEIRRAGVEHEDDGKLDKKTRERLDAAIERVTICDPAVGSGAFLVGSMQELVLLRKGILQLAEKRAPESHEVASWKRRIISHNLYGVDINPGAVEICRLRLWLSLVLEEEQPDDEPLPNLDFRIVAGDSLIDRIGDIDFEDSLGRRQATQSDMLHGLHTEIAESIRVFQETKHAGHARQRRDKVRRLKREAMILQLQHHIDQLSPGVIAKEKRLREHKRLGATERILKSLAKELAAAKAQLTQLTDARERIETTHGDVQKPFLWPVEFPEVFDPATERSPGFDVVLANPPYVRQEKLSAIDQEAYAESFEDVYTGMADLLVFFYARAVQTLRIGGQLAFITSNKFMRAAYGSGLREFLPSRLQISRVLDFGDLPLFDAAAYPAVIVGTRTEAPFGEEPLEVANLTRPIRHALEDRGVRVAVETVREALEDLEALLNLVAVRSYPQSMLRPAGWILEDPSLVRLFERLMNSGTPLGKFVHGRIYYGIKTGLGEAFIIDEARRAELIRTDRRSEELIKPWLRGRDIKRWRPEWAGLHAIFTRRGIDIDEYPAVRNHLTQYRKPVFDQAGKLLRKGLEPNGGSDYRKKGDYKWFETQDSIAYFAEFAEPKVIFNRFINGPGFALDTDGFLHNDACYFCVVPSPAIVAVLNSRLCWWLLSHLCTPLQNGYLQVFIQFLEILPVPTGIDAIEDKLVQLVEEIRQGTDRVRTERLETEIDALVFDAYGVSVQEASSIREWFDESHRAAIGDVSNTTDDDEEVDV